MTPLDRHSLVALAFSGGKDSLAVAYMLRPHWDRLTFYHLDTGDSLPEVREIVDETASMVPHFVRLRGDVGGWQAQHGLASDLVPTSNTGAGVMIGMADQRIVDRFDCCTYNIMLPLHQRMVADGITLVIRGTKKADLKKLPAKDGDTSAGYELWLPIAEWSHEDVFAYLRKVGAPLCRVYENNVNAPECATCTAWWSENRARYLKKHHPELAAIYRAKLERVAREVTPMWNALQAELADG